MDQELGWSTLPLLHALAMRPDSWTVLIAEPLGQLDALTHRMLVSYVTLNSVSRLSD